MKLNDAAFDLSNGPVLDDVSGSLQCVRVRFSLFALCLRMMPLYVECSENCLNRLREKGHKCSKPK